MAITDNLNFGNPERPEIMGQFVGCIKGIREACIALDYPVVSGNVSLYNETNGEGILPTPTIGGVGLLLDIDKRASIAFDKEGQDIVLIGETLGHLGQSLYLREIENREDGTPPPVDLNKERQNGNFVRDLIRNQQITTCHDVSGGGICVALAEMAIASGIGCNIEVPKKAQTMLGWLFGEDQARYLISADNASSIIANAERHGIIAEKIGQTIGKELTVGAEASISLEVLENEYINWLPLYMAMS